MHFQRDENYISNSKSNWGKSFSHNSIFSLETNRTKTFGHILSVIFENNPIHFLSWDVKPQVFRQLFLSLSYNLLIYFSNSFSA